MKIDVCPGCRGGRSAPSVRHVARCSSCRTEYNRVQPSDERLSEIYGPDYYRPWSFEASEVVEGMKKMTFGRVLDKAALKDGSRILELGCANGDFASLAVERGFLCSGVDLNDDAVDEARQRVPGARFHSGVLADNPWPDECFDAVVMIDFIEHVRDPGMELRLAMDRLEKGGRLVLSTPEAGSVVHRLTRRFWPQYREEHLTYFSRNGLRQLFERMECQIVHIGTSRKAVTANYLYGQLLAYPIPVLTPAIRRLWRVLPVSKTRVRWIGFGEMVVVVERR
jgi:2-polyprenyl-3-methyl-5-hydroxy-6-metoxy-1,4-benzoquinol methylase